ncbi:MAG: dTDP-4-dehydrorhamnose 3,5-epimerase family protein [Methanosarcinaceae archaeon]|nr:dTDP-4-dehydrorhamnose 3,5-epimerase family protein [Methanosarcinaceae archaeon]
MIEGVELTSLTIIPGDKGNIMHAMKRNERSFHGFGEAYFSTITKGTVKAWKRHREMTLNLIVPCGDILFALWDDRPDSKSCGELLEIQLSPENYQRLTVPPMVWMGFKGLGNGTNMLLNIANIPHDPNESDQMDVYKNNINYNWYM